MEKPEIVVEGSDKSASSLSSVKSPIEAMSYLKPSDMVFSKRLNNKLTGKIKDAQKSPQEGKKRALLLLDKLVVETEEEKEDKGWKELHKMIVEATQDVYIEQNDKIVQLEKDFHKRWTRKKAALVSTVCSVISTFGAAIITYFCEKYV